MADDHPDILEMGDQAKTAYDSVDTTRKLAGAGTEAAVEGLSLLKSAARGFFKKVPLIGTAFGIVATAVAMSRAARAGDAARPDDKAPGAEDQRRRELEQWKAEMETDKKVMKAFVVGMTGLMPVPFADKALSAYIDSEEEARKERGDRALHGKKKIDYDSQYLLFHRANGTDGIRRQKDRRRPGGCSAGPRRKRDSAVSRSPRHENPVSFPRRFAPIAS